MQIEYSIKSIKYINSADRLSKKKIKEAIDDGYRLRVEVLRVLFSMKNDIIYIDNIIPRGQTHKRL